MVLVCHEGYTSSLAAAGPHDLGLHRATDLVGGFRAWAAAALPVSTGAPSAARSHLPTLRAAAPGRTA